MTLPIVVLAMLLAAAAAETVMTMNCEGCNSNSSQECLVMRGGGFQDFMLPNKCQPYVSYPISLTFYCSSLCRTGCLILIDMSGKDPAQICSESKNGKFLVDFLDQAYSAHTGEQSWTGNLCNCEVPANPNISTENVTGPNGTATNNGEVANETIIENMNGTFNYTVGNKANFTITTLPNATRGNGSRGSRGQVNGSRGSRGQVNGSRGSRGQVNGSRGSRGQVNGSRGQVNGSRGSRGQVNGSRGQVNGSRGSRDNRNRVDATTPPITTTPRRSSSTIQTFVHPSTYNRNLQASLPPELIVR